MHRRGWVTKIKQGEEEEDKRGREQDERKK